ncbi:hypothetical protein [Albirhodobacter sp. R86504]|uniref:hypothetical protein n=1 Tax=Albirhodobacter sp. R86504 TaxID=3093848 RepID=UPI00366F34AA
MARSQAPSTMEPGETARQATERSQQPRARAHRILALLGTARRHRAATTPASAPLTPMAADHETAPPQMTPDLKTASAVATPESAIEIDQAEHLSPPEDTAPEQSAMKTAPLPSIAPDVIAPTPVPSRTARNMELQISGIRAFISRLECEIATRHGQRAERELTIKGVRLEVSALETALSQIQGKEWLDLVEHYNTVKTKLTALVEADKRQTAIDISDDPHMEAELIKWRQRLSLVTQGTSARH